MATPRTLARAREALRMRCEGATLRQIGGAMGVSAERARQLINVGKTQVLGTRVDKTAHGQRQRDIVLMRLSGASFADIAAKLMIGERQVRRYLSDNGKHSAQYAITAETAEALGLDDYRLAAAGALRVGSGWAARCP